MTPKEQEALYRDIHAVHPQWPPRFLSGYVHGAVDEENYRTPRSEMVHNAHDLDHYALGYLTGFAMRRGQDAETELWFDFVALIVRDARAHD